jgi:hypothetical protein
MPADRRIGEWYCITVVLRIRADDAAAAQRAVGAVFARGTAPGNYPWRDNFTVDTCAVLPATPENGGPWTDVEGDETDE